MRKALSRGMTRTDRGKHNKELAIAAICMRELHLAPSTHNSAVRPLQLCRQTSPHLCNSDNCWSLLRTELQMFPRCLSASHREFHGPKGQPGQRHPQTVPMGLRRFLTFLPYTFLVTERGCTAFSTCENTQNIGIYRYGDQNVGKKAECAG